MGSPQICFCCHRNRQLFISLLLLLVSSSTLVRFMAEGRAITKRLEAAAPTQKGAEEEKMMVRSQTIGSRPPACDRRCSSCGHCKAVQVPVTTQSQNRKRSHFFAAIPSIEYSRGDDISNYKPMSWKCKCGNLIFNP